MSSTEDFQRALVTSTDINLVLRTLEATQRAVNVATTKLEEFRKDRNELVLYLLNQGVATAKISRATGTSSAHISQIKHRHNRRERGND